MEEHQRKKALECADTVQKQAEVIQVQVLNNLDSLVEMATSEQKPIDPVFLDKLVKGPIMRAVAALKRTKIQLVSLANSK